MEIDRIAVHESAAETCRLEDVVKALADLPVRVEVVGDDSAFGQGDCVVTFDPREAFLEADWVHCTRAGIDAFDLAAYENAGTILTTSSGVHEDSVPETVVGSLATLARRLHVYRDRQADREWRQEPPTRPFTLTGEQVCVVGLGTIGRGVSRRADALGMEVVGVRRSGESVPEATAVHPPDRLHEAVAVARFVVLACPLTPETHGMVDAGVLAAMREDAYLVNVARGPVIDEADLLAALDEGDIAGGAFDAHWTEPLPADHPLWGYDDVLVTPHCSGFTAEYGARVADLVRENHGRLAGGESLVNRAV